MKKLVNGEKAQCGDKIARYGWNTKDSKGELAWVDKNILSVDNSYQRTASPSRVLTLAKNWSWAGCGVIILSRRGSQLFVIDGQHRVMAALKRSDITHLPAIIFNNVSSKNEAESFINANVNRGALKMIEKFKALVKKEDDGALMVQSMLDKYGVCLCKNSKSRSTNSAARLLKTIKKYPEKTELVFKTAVNICGDDFISEYILGGLWILDSKIKGGLKDDKLQKRLISIGKTALEDAAKRASAFFAKGGESVWADGMLQEINKNLRNKFEVEL